MVKLYELDKGDHFKLAGIGWDGTESVYRFHLMEDKFGLCYDHRGRAVRFIGYTPVVRVKAPKFRRHK
jgi:hypothetical protein